MAVTVKRKLMHKFLFSILTVIIVGMAGLTFFSYTMAKDALRETVEKQVTQIVESTVKSMSFWVNDRRLDVSNWSKQKVYQSSVQDSFLGKAARKGATAELVRLKEEYGYYSDILLLDKAGNVIAASNPDLIGVEKLDSKNYFQEAISGSFFVSQVIQSNQTGRPIFAIASPVLKGESVKGVLCGFVDMDYFNSLFAGSVKLGKTGYAFTKIIEVFISPASHGEYMSGSSLLSDTGDPAEILNSRL